MDDTFDDAKPQDAGSPSATSSEPQLLVLLERSATRGRRTLLLARCQSGHDGRGDERMAVRRQSGGISSLDLRLPGRSLSKTHARLIRVGASWAIEDTNSKNGTYVNNRRVDRAVLEPCDLCELGHTWLRVRPSGCPGPGTQADLDASDARADLHSTLDVQLASQFETLATVAASEVPVLILGDSGTGKEVLARWIHRVTRDRGPFVAVNCGALPATLVESQLFGHLRAAFSSAVRDEPGLVRSADGGTLLPSTAESCVGPRRPRPSWGTCAPSCRPRRRE